MHPSKLNPNHKRRVPGQGQGSCEPTSDSFQSGHTVTAQLQAAAEQGACDISKHIMVELERRLERKERCQGFETFFVGIILLNCIERMSWAMKRASLTEEAQDVCNLHPLGSRVPLTDGSSVDAWKIHRFIYGASRTLCRVPFETVPDARDTCGRPARSARWHSAWRS